MQITASALAQPSLTAAAAATPAPAPSGTTTTFLGDVFVARNHVDKARAALNGPHLMYQQPKDHLASSVTDARAAIKLLTDAQSKPASRTALSAAAAAVSALTAAVAMATSATTRPLDPSAVDQLYVRSLSHIDRAITHSAMLQTM